MENVLLGKAERERQRKLHLLFTNCMLGTFKSISNEERAETTLFTDIKTGAQGAYRISPDLQGF